MRSCSSNYCSFPFSAVDLAFGLNIYKKYITAGAQKPSYGGVDRTWGGNSILCTRVCINSRRPLPPPPLHTAICYLPTMERLSRQQQCFVDFDLRLLFIWTWGQQTDLTWLTCNGHHPWRLTPLSPPSPSSPPHRASSNMACCFQCIPNAEIGVIERLGKYQGLAQPG